MSVNEKMKAIADAIRDRMGTSELLTLDGMASEVYSVYDKGVNEGYMLGEINGIEAEYDRFWDAFQQNGTRSEYQYAFAGGGWDTGAFKPKYDLNVTRADYMFSGWLSANFDLSFALEESGVKLDTSKCTNFTYFTRYNSPARFPEIDTRSATALTNMFANAGVVTVDKLILKADGSQNLSNAIFMCYNLVNIAIEGVIGYDGFNVQWSAKLSHDSIISIINALSTTTSGYKITLSKTAVSNAFEQLEGANDGASSAEWQDLIATRSNWTISLI